MDHAHLLGEFEFTLEDALAKCLRRIMDQSGRPQRKDYHFDPSLYDLHIRQWDDAKKVLAAYEAQKKE